MFFIGYISNNYHDYVFRNGEFVGLFDDMYKYSKDIPWHQDKTAFQWFGKIGFLMVEDIVKNKNRPFSKILEVGCGLGYVISQFKPYADNLYACDISVTALEKAKELHKGIEFFFWDAQKDARKEKYELVVMFDVMWYVLKHLENVKQNILKLISKGGYFLFRQGFPPLDQPYVGKQKFPDINTMVEFWDCFEIINLCEVNNVKGSPILWLMGRKK